MYIQRNSIIAQLNFFQTSTNDTPYVRASHGPVCVFWGQRLIFVLLPSLRCCMKYLVIWDRVITAIDCILPQNDRVMGSHFEWQIDEPPKYDVRLPTLHWRHDERNDVSNHQFHDYLHNRLIRRRSKKISKLCVTGLCEGKSPVTGEFSTQRASNAENVSNWWRNHEQHWHPCCHKFTTLVCVVAFVNNIEYIPISHVYRRFIYIYIYILNYTYYN